MNPTVPINTTRRRWFALGVLALVVFGGVGLYRYGNSKPAAPDPPAPDLSQVDPAIRQVIETERERVGREPQSGVAWGRLGMAYYAHIFGHEAMACFEQAERLDPDNPRWPYFQGLIHLSNDPPAAGEPLRRAVTLVHDDTDGPRLRLGELYLRLGRLDEAAEHFGALIKRQPAHARAHLGLARVAHFRGDAVGAREQLRHAVNHAGTRKAALMLSADIHQRHGDARAARQEQARAVGLPEDPEWPDKYGAETAPFQVGEVARLRLAGQMMERNREMEAASELQQLVRDYPQSAAAWTLLGWAHMSLEQLPPAEQALRAALRFDSGQTRAWLYLGVVRLKRGDRTEAIACFREAGRRQPTYLEAHFNLGVCLKDGGDFEGAVAAFRDALRSQPLSAPVHAHLGEALLKQGRTEEALGHLRQAVELNPEDSVARTLMEEAQKRPTK
ncbi:MAG TPA: tetratricopeptide repeat protein [Gemmataceae bacterium]|nr:tetratricopeptide repeat protein [Gemmataceae bacterium]